MLKLSGGQSGEALHTVLIVVFNPVSGQVHGTFVHASYGDDAAGVTRSRQRFLEEIRSQLRPKAKLETLTVPPGKIPAGSITRVEPKTRKLLIEERGLNPSAGVPVIATPARKKTK